ncbi:MAG: hypothetical protein ABII07_00225 [Patescibacteria group bacterium]|nr:hypothetical protein [Patescibacteria group bacterium]
MRLQCNATGSAFNPDRYDPLYREGFEGDDFVEGNLARDAFGLRLGMALEPGEDLEKDEEVDWFTPIREASRERNKFWAGR